MNIVTKENAKEHCRTCLIKFIKAEAEFLEDDIDTLDDNYPINIQENEELQNLLERYLDIGVKEKEVESSKMPQMICLQCYNKLQMIEKFRKQALETTKKLISIFAATSQKGSRKETKRNETNGELLDNIYNMLTRDNLMETESVLLNSSSVSSISNVALNDPDPFDNSSINISLPMSEEIFIKEEEECNSMDRMDSLDWAEDENESTNSSWNEDPDYTPTVSENNSVNIEILDENAQQISSNKNKRSKQTKTTRESVQSEDPSSEKVEKVKRRNKGTRNKFKCDKCNHCFAHKITLDAHIRKIHEGSKKPFQCDRCDKSYSFIGGLYTHKKEVHEVEVRSHPCDHPGCERVYTSIIAMHKHKRLKHSDSYEQKTYCCEQCGATFNQSGNLKHHRRTKHPTEEEKAEKEKEKLSYKCEICQKLFHSRYTLKYHNLQLHSDDMNYACNICGRRMAKKFMLAQHMLVHSTDKMPCPHCSKQFIRKFELEAHIKAVHMKLKPFACQYCSECFASRKTLRHHEYIHTGEKPYKCDICGQAYRQQTCLKNHRKLHAKNEANSSENSQTNSAFISSE